MNCPFKTLSVDIETFSSVNIKKSGLYKYVQAPDFQILLFAYSYEKEPVKVIDVACGEYFPLWVQDVLRDPAVKKKAYNAAFEWYCLSKFLQTPLEQWHCTMAHGMYCGYPAGLSAMGDAVGLPQDKRKLSTGSALINTFCVPCKPTNRNGYRTRILPHHEPEKWQLFKEYCKQDVTAEMEIEGLLSGFPVPENEHKLWQLDQVINATGVAVDKQFVDSALYCSNQVTDELMTEAVQISGLDNPKSVSQLKAWFEVETEEEISDLQKGTVKSLLKTTDNETAKRMLEIRQELAKTSVKKYVAMDEAMCEDGRARGLLQYYGANRTGRWAGRLVQVQNLPRNYLKILDYARELVKSRKLDALKVVYGNIPDTLSQLIRTAFIPSPGHVFAVADYSAIEARVIAWLAGEQWRLDVFATHGKIYEASASQMFGVPIELIVKDNPEYELRQKGKVAELALGYQGGAGALITMGALNQGLTEEELPDIVRRWRSANKRIVDLWYSVERAAIDVMKTGAAAGVKGLIFTREIDPVSGLDFFTIALPSGRKLYYPKPFLKINQFDKDALHYWGVDQDTKKWSELSTYGGKLVENIVQAIARDCLAESLLRLSKAGYRTIMHIHDEVVIEIFMPDMDRMVEDCKPFNDFSPDSVKCDNCNNANECAKIWCLPEPQVVLETICDLMGQPIPWAPGLILKAEGFITNYYKKE
jgi:DNA polymerase